MEGGKSNKHQACENGALDEPEKPKSRKKRFYFTRNISKDENNDMGQCHHEYQEGTSAFRSRSQSQCPARQSTVLDNNSNSANGDYDLTLEETTKPYSDIKGSCTSLHRHDFRGSRANRQKRDHGEWVVSETLTLIPYYTQGNFHQMPRNSRLPPTQYLPDIPQRCCTNRWSMSQTGTHPHNWRESASTTQRPRNPTMSILQRHSFSKSSPNNGYTRMMYYPDRRISRAGIEQFPYTIEDHRRSGRCEEFTPRVPNNSFNAFSVNVDQVRDIHDSRIQNQKATRRESGNNVVQRKEGSKHVLQWNSHLMAGNPSFSEDPENTNLKSWHEVCRGSNQCLPKSRYFYSKPSCDIKDAHMCKRGQNIRRLPRDPVNVIDMELEQTRSTSYNKRGTRVNENEALCKNVIPRRQGSKHVFEEDSQWHPRQHMEPRANRKKSSIIYASPPREASSHDPHRKLRPTACNSSFCQELCDMDIRSDAETYDDLQYNPKQRLHPIEPPCDEDDLLRGRSRSYRQALMLGDPLDATAVDLEQTRDACNGKSTLRAKKRSKHGRHGKSNLVSGTSKFCQNKDNDEFRSCDESCQDRQCGHKYQFSPMESSSATGDNLTLNGAHGVLKESDTAISRVSDDQLSAIGATSEQTKDTCSTDSIEQVIPLQNANRDHHQRTLRPSNSTCCQYNDTVNSNSQFQPNERISRMEPSSVCEREKDIPVKEERRRRRTRRRKVNSMVNNSEYCEDEKSKNMQPMEKSGKVKSKSMICQKQCSDKEGRNSLEIEREGRPRSEKPTMNHDNDSRSSSSMVKSAEEEYGGECVAPKTDPALEDFLQGKVQNRRQAICKEIEKTLNLVKLNGSKMSLYDLRKDLCKLVGDHVFQGIHEEEG